MLKKTIHRPNHRERAQPLEREKWGVLEKHKRAKDYNEKKARLKILRQKAAERNPDEFAYSMLSSRSKAGRKISDRRNQVLSQDAVKLLKTQDSGYLRTMLSKTRRAVEKLEQEFVLRERQSVQVLGGPEDQDEAQHVVFVDSRKEQKAYTPGAPAASRGNNDSTAQNTLDQHALNDSEGELVNDLLQKVPKSRRAARREEEASKQDNLLRNQHQKEQHARRAKLAALKAREKDLIDAENELELQRAKMSNNVGGVTKAGVKWKPRERKSFWASGLGRATARNLIDAGGYVSILDMNKDGGQELVKELGSERSKFIQVDVSDTESIAQAVKETLAWVKETGKELGGVIAAAGVSTPAKIIDRHGDPFDLKGFDFVMNINVRGSIDLVRLLLPHMTKVKPEAPDGERGIIVLVSSSAAFDGQPGQVSYAASKGALASLTLPLTRDLAKYGVRVVTIAPSLFDSGMTALMSDKVRSSLTRVMEFPPRPGKPEEFSRIVREGIENSMLNGVVIRLDGGMRMPSKL